MNKKNALIKVQNLWIFVVRKCKKWSNKWNLGRCLFLFIMYVIESHLLYSTSSSSAVSMPTTFACRSADHQIDNFFMAMVLLSTALLPLLLPFTAMHVICLKPLLLPPPKCS